MYYVADKALLKGLRNKSQISTVALMKAGVFTLFSFLKEK
jgi:hypothetical protein